MHTDQPSEQKHLKEKHEIHLQERRIEREFEHRRLEKLTARLRVIVETQRLARAS